MDSDERIARWTPSPDCEDNLVEQVVAGTLERSLSPQRATNESTSNNIAVTLADVRVHKQFLALVQQSSVVAALRQVTPTRQGLILALLERYYNFLRLLADAHAEQNENLATAWATIAPPLDVVVMWYIHMTSDLTLYADDMGHLFGIEFRDAVLRMPAPFEQIIAAASAEPTDGDLSFTGRTGHAAVPDWQELATAAHGRQYTVSCNACTESPRTMEVEQLVPKWLFGFSLSFHLAADHFVSQLAGVVEGATLSLEEVDDSWLLELLTTYSAVMQDAAHQQVVSMRRMSLQQPLAVTADALSLHWWHLSHPQEYLDYSLRRFGQVIVFNQLPGEPDTEKATTEVTVEQTAPVVLETSVRELAIPAPAAAAAAAAAAATADDNRPKIKGPSVQALRAMFNGSRTSKQAVTVAVPGNLPDDAELQTIFTRDVFEAHGKLLQHFLSHLGLARHQDKNEEGKVDTLYLFKAENRYYLWLLMLSEHAKVADAGEAPLPPLDVLLLWYVHMTHPAAYAHDLECIFGTAAARQILSYAFPLRQYMLQHLSHQADVQSQNQWERVTGKPFVLLHNADVVEEPWLLQCMHCQSLTPVEVSQFIQLRLGTTAVECPNCCNNITKRALLEQSVPQLYTAFATFTIDLILTAQQWKASSLSALVDHQNNNSDEAIVAYNRLWRRSTSVIEHTGLVSVYKLAPADYTASVRFGSLTHALWPSHYQAMSNSVLGCCVDFADEEAVMHQVTDLGSRAQRFRVRPLRLRKATAATLTAVEEEVDASQPNLVDDEAAPEAVVAAVALEVATEETAAPVAEIGAEEVALEAVAEHVEMDTVVEEAEIAAAQLTDEQPEAIVATVDLAELAVDTQEAVAEPEPVVNEPTTAEPVLNESAVETSPADVAIAEDAPVEDVSLLEQSILAQPTLVGGADLALTLSFLEVVVATLAAHDESGVRSLVGQYAQWLAQPTETPSLAVAACWLAHVTQPKQYLAAVQALHGDSTPAVLLDGRVLLQVTDGGSPSAVEAAETSTSAAMEVQLTSFLDTAAKVVKEVEATADFGAIADQYGRFTQLATAIQDCDGETELYSLVPMSTGIQLAQLAHAANFSEFSAFYQKEYGMLPMLTRPAPPAAASAAQLALALPSEADVDSLRQYAEHIRSAKLVDSYRRPAYLANALVRYKFFLQSLLAATRAAKQPLAPPADVLIVLAAHMVQADHFLADVASLLEGSETALAYLVDLPGDLHKEPSASDMQRWEQESGQEFVLDAECSAVTCSRCKSRIQLHESQTVRTDCMVCCYQLTNIGCQADLSAAVPFFLEQLSLAVTAGYAQMDAYRRVLELSTRITDEQGESRLYTIGGPLDTVLLLHLAHLLQPVQYQQSCRALYSSEPSVFLCLPKDTEPKPDLSHIPMPPIPQPILDATAGVALAAASAASSVYAASEVANHEPEFAGTTAQQIVASKAMAAHLKLLNRLITQSDHEDLGVFCRSESRYYKWLTLIAERKIWHATPPPDVALIAHMHMFHALAYRNDLERIFGPADAHIIMQFSLLDLAEEPCSGVADPFSVSLWESFTGEPYLVQKALPSAEYIMSCPTCSSVQGVAQSTLADVKLGSGQIACSACHAANDLNALKLTNRMMAPFSLNFLHEYAAWKSRASATLQRYEHLPLDIDCVQLDSISATYDRFVSLTCDITSAEGEQRLYSLVSVNDDVTFAHDTHKLSPAKYFDLVQRMHGRLTELIDTPAPLTPLPVAVEPPVSVPIAAPEPVMEETEADDGRPRSMFDNATMATMRSMPEVAPDFAMRPETLLAVKRVSEHLLHTAVFQFPDAKFESLYWARAEHRYVKFLGMLAKAHASAWDDVVLLPPMDVLMLWMIHMSDTTRYFEDLVRLFGDVSLMSILFPVSAMCAFLDSNVEPSAEAWQAFVGDKVTQQWTADAGDSYTLNYKDTSGIPIACPSCQHSQVWDCHLYAEMRNGTRMLYCEACNHGITVSTLSAWRLVGDLRKAQTGSGHVGGTLLNLAKGRLDHKLAKRVHYLLFEAHSTPLTQVIEERLASRSVVNPWKDLEVAAIIHDYVVTAVKKTEKDGSRRDAKRRADVVASKIIAYYQNVMAPVSLDLIKGLHNWRVMTRDILHDLRVFGMQEAATVIVRYAQFLALIEERRKLRDEGSRYSKIAPTLDILLAHRAHMLEPLVYQKFCAYKFGKILDFGRFTSKKELIQQYRHMRALWRQKYSTPFDVAFKPRKKGVKAMLQRLFK
ncbi:hypothetical protein RI367_007645 [Sorochytrium milnesiophthora]